MRGKPAMKSKKAKPIVEERNEIMVSVTGGKPTIRTARFLHPFVTSVDEAMKVPHVPSLLSRTVSTKPGETWLMKADLFKGWKAPMRKWKKWVDKMVQMHEPTWRKVCIYDAIMASTYEVKKDENLVFGLAELWCPETNTFVFPWGEATITLEDMLILGGFSVLGEPVTSPLNANLLEIKERLNEERQGLYKQKAQKPTCGAWMNHFMKNKDIDRDLEHVAFLVLWLSRYVFQTHPLNVIGKHVFSIAIHLAHGTRMALAPAVLSSLYRDLSLLNQNVVCDVWALFHILELWAWEHFPLLRPTKPVNRLHKDDPRVARWHKLSTSVELQFVRSVLRVHDNFQWRCYTKDVTNWRHPSFYKENEMWVLYNSYIDDELRSFARCLRACELVGLDCIEQYLPYRVAMQFGLDQDLPGYFTRANLSWKDAWRTYDKSIKMAEFYIPPRLFVSNVTTRYLDWWKHSMSYRNTLGNILHQGSSKSSENEDQDEHYGSVPSKCRKLKLQPEVNHENCSADDEIPLSQRFGLSRNRTEVVDLTVDSDTPSSSTQSPTSLPSMIQTDMEINRGSSTMVTEKNVSNKCNKSEVSGENDKQIRKEAHTIRTDQDIELEHRILKLVQELGEIKDIVMANRSKNNSVS